MLIGMNPKIQCSGKKGSRHILEWKKGMKYSVQEEVLALARDTKRSSTSTTTTKKTDYTATGARKWVNKVLAPWRSFLLSTISDI